MDDSEFGARRQDSFGEHSAHRRGLPPRIGSQAAEKAVAMAEAAVTIVRLGAPYLLLPAALLAGLWLPMLLPM